MYVFHNQMKVRLFVLVNENKSNWMKVYNVFIKQSLTLFNFGYFETHLDAIVCRPGWSIEPLCEASFLWRWGNLIIRFSPLTELL